MGWLGTSTEGCRLCSSACILLSLIHLLLELFGLLFVDKAQTSQAFFKFEGMKKGPVLVVVPRIENLLVPDNSSIGGRNIHHLDPVCISNKIVDERNGSL